MNPEKVLVASARAGRLLLENGAEIYRVEDTIERICQNYGGEEVASFVTPSGIFISFVHDGKTFSKVVRIKKSSLDLERIHEVNDLARRCNRSYNIDLMIEELKIIENRTNYSEKMKIIGSAGVAGCFSVFFGGSLTELLCGAFIGAVVRYTLSRMQKRNINNFVSVIFESALIALLSLILEMLGITVLRDSIVIGSLMLLVPGLAITNAIRDSISGDFLSGMTRACEAFMTAIALASGAGVTLALWMHFLGGIQ